MPVLDIGGVEKNFLVIANNLCKKFQNLTVISTSFLVREKLNKKIKLKGPKNFLIEKLSRRIKFLICLYYLTVQIILNPKSLVLCFQGNMYCVFICKLLGVKILLRSNSSPSGWSKNKFKLMLYKFGLSLANGIIVNSIDFKKELKKKFNINSKCIYNPLNIIEIKKLSKKNIRFNFFKKNHLNIINVGRLEDQKDHLTLIKSINEINNKIKIKLLIIGNGSKQIELLEIIKNMNLEKNIKILNNVTNPFPYIIKADLFVLSSLFEGLPNVLLEASCLNKFIISTDCPTGPSEILEKGKGGILVPIKDYKKMGEKILFFKKNKKNLKKKTSYSMKRLNRFEYNSKINEYVKFIKNFI
tara:strand:- start:11824 stop:12894 length:1071 start_codon:yes stop_codon:yes gene_type:complete